jgi:hypothetical protein
MKNMQVTVIASAILLVILLWLSFDSDKKSFDSMDSIETQPDQPSQDRQSANTGELAKPSAKNTVGELPPNDSLIEKEKTTSSRTEIPQESAFAETLNLTPEQIGNRPQELIHILATTPPFDGSYINNYQVSPGLAPRLFRTAGFREGDILKAINDQDISDPENFRRANASIADADTLKFSVIRNGQPITLYLDIPSETLKITR